MSTKLIIPKDDLINLYENKKWSIVRIAKHFNTSNVTIKNRMKEYNIYRNPSPQYIDLSDFTDEMIDLHHNHNVTLLELSKKYGVSISKMSTHFSRENIPVKNLNKLQIPSKETLHELYHKNLMSLTVIGNKYNTTVSTVSSWMREHDINLRTHSENQKLFVKRVPIPPKNELKKMREHMTIEELVSYYKTSMFTLKSWFDEYDISIVSHRISHIPPKRELEKYYIDDEMSLDDIRNIYGVARKTVSKWIKLHEIPPRSKKRRYEIIYENMKRTKTQKYGDPHYPLKNEKFHETYDIKYCESKGELELGDFLRSSTMMSWEKDRNVLGGMELDFLSGDNKFAVEYCGLYWHSEHKGKNRYYHIDKHNICKERGIRLFTVFEDEWKYNKNWVCDSLCDIIHHDRIPSGIVPDDIEIGQTIKTDNRWCLDNKMIDMGFVCQEEFIGHTFITKSGPNIRMEHVNFDGNIHTRIFDCGQKIWKFIPKTLNIGDL